MHILQNPRLLIKAALLAACVLFYGSCSEAEEELPNIYACGLDQNNIRTSYYSFDAENDMYEIFLSGMEESDHLNSYILLDVSGSLLGGEQYDLLDMPSGIDRYNMSITVIHNHISINYSALKTIGDTYAAIVSDDIASGTLLISKEPGCDRFLIKLNIIDKDDNKILCTYEGAIERR